MSVSESSLRSRDRAVPSGQPTGRLGPCGPVPGSLTTNHKLSATAATTPTLTSTTVPVRRLRVREHPAGAVETPNCLFYRDEAAVWHGARTAIVPTRSLSSGLPTRRATSTGLSPVRAVRPFSAVTSDPSAAVTVTVTAAGAADAQSPDEPGRHRSRRPSVARTPRVHAPSDRGPSQAGTISDDFYCRRRYAPLCPHRQTHRAERKRRSRARECGRDSRSVTLY